MAIKEFDFTTKVKETSWLVEGLIPSSHLCFVLAQAGVGKSLLVNGIAISVIHGLPFGSLKTMEGDVLIIDQDTPENTLAKRLLRLNNGVQTEKKHRLFVESMQGYTLSERTLQTIIKSYPTAVLIIVDSLHSVVGKLNPNYTTDMSALAKLKSTCLNSHNTIIFNHHISQKTELSIEDLMLGDTGHLAMGSSTIIQQADTYFIVGATAREGKTERIYIRPVSKRVSIPSKPLVLRLLDTQDGEIIEHDGFYEVGLTEVENDVMALFNASNTNRSVKEVYEAMGHRHGENTVRTALASLDKKGLLLMSKHQSNLFKYRLP